MQDDVLGRSPASQAPHELDAEDAGRLELPRSPDQGLDGIGAADADGYGAEAAGVRRVAVGAEHQQAREGVVLQYRLVDDAGAGRPEVYAVLLGADLRKSKTSWFVLTPARRSSPAPFSPTIRWSQWMLAGMAVRGRWHDMNCSSAIWADASCMLTRSGLSLRLAWPRMSRPILVPASRDSPTLSRWL